MSFAVTDSAADYVSIIFNGPALAGVGATTDAGLASDKYHVVPYNLEPRVEVVHSHDPKGHKLIAPPSIAWGHVSAARALRMAVHNVDSVYKFADAVASVAALDTDSRARIRLDLICIIFLMIAYNLYGGESRVATTAEITAVDAIAITANDGKEMLKMENINRAATFIIARMHTKYQTNHVLGGNPMQASMASSVRAFYGLGVAKSNEARAKHDAIASALHWALHPANERLLIPQVMMDTHIDSAEVPQDGPKPVVIALEEYFNIRASTPPASTHHFYVCAAAVRHLAPLGILPYLPAPGRLSDVKTGWALIKAHGAKLHPAANYWGLERVSANQKLVEPLAADLGYAVRKLMPGSSLAASPILLKEDALDAGWKGFVDALRAAMDAKGGELIDATTLEAVKKAIAPKAQDTPVIREVAGLISAVPASFLAPAPPDPNAPPSGGAGSSGGSGPAPP